VGSRKSVVKDFCFKEYSPHASFSPVGANKEMVNSEDDHTFNKADMVVGDFGKQSISTGYKISCMAGDAYLSLVEFFGRPPSDKKIQNFISDNARTHIVQIRESLRKAINDEVLKLYNLSGKWTDGYIDNRFLSSEGFDSIQRALESMPAYFELFNNRNRPLRLLEHSNQKAIDFLGLDADTDMVNGNRLGEEWIRLTERCAVNGIQLDTISVRDKKAVLSAFCLVAFDNILISIENDGENLLNEGIEFQKLYDMANLGWRDNDIAHNVSLSALRKKAVNARHDRTTTRLREYAIYEFQNGKDWKSTLAAANSIFSRVQDYATENKIPRLSEETGPKTVYHWLLKSLKNK
jgi:hypothetical protein